LASQKTEKIYVNLDHSQDSKEKLCICEAIAHVEFYTKQIMIVSDEDSIDCIGSHEE
jgi:hypothetical protein